MSAVVDAICPPRMGRGFRWLLASSWVTNLGDGIAIAAGPLLVASQTNDPLLIALAGLLQRLPWVLFGLQAGVFADRHDRRRIVVVVNLVRAGVLALLATTILTGTVSVTVVLIAMFALGTAEAITDITASTLLPMVVDHDDLGVANSRFVVGHITVNQLAGPPLGAFLFAAGMALPFVSYAVLMAFGAVLVARCSVTRLPSTARQSVRAEIGEGIRWLWGHAAMRTLTLTIVSFNVTFGAALSIEVLYAFERLGLGDVGFGLLVTSSAVGGVLGSTAYGRLERSYGVANLMRIGLVIETVTHLTLALTTTVAVAFGILFVFGAHESVWGTTVTTVRQRAVPAEFQGRVGSVYMLALQGGLVVGAGLGGLIARQWGVTGPFWFAFAGSALILVSIWRRLDDITHTHAT